MLLLLTAFDDVLADTTPDAFSFTDASDAPLSTVVESDSVVLTGVDTACDISVTGGEYSKNGGAYTSAAGTAEPEDTIQVRGTSSGSFATAVDVVFTAGGVSDTFTITTLADPGPITPAAGRARDARRGMSRGFAFTSLTRRGRG